METIIVLAMHGMPPKDFPPDDLQEFFSLHARVHGAPDSLPDEILRRYEELSTRMCNWPRDEVNDPFHVAALEIAQLLENEVSLPVSVAYNEFCSPTLDEVFASAIRDGAAKVIVATLMMTRGGDHAEVDIPAAIAHARERYPGVQFTYAWPFEPQEIARFLAGQIHWTLDL